jgi:glycosyltransferase involved in cell wall biosynthesis
MNFNHDQADICLILEGTYPFVPGGVSNWTHDLISSLTEFKFHLCSIVPQGFKLELKYKLPKNVVGLSTIVLQKIPKGKTDIRDLKKNFSKLESPLFRIQSSNASLQDLSEVLHVLKPYQEQLGIESLLNSQESWNLLLHMYEKEYLGNSFLDYFWSWRIIMGGFFSLMLAPLPSAGIYHATSTGYAGLLLSKAKIETGRPVLVTEHGIYTNERRIEISISKWLYETSFARLSIDKMNKNLKDLWINTFQSYSRVCYEACEKIITLFPGNQIFQKADGASTEKLMVIPNGVECNKNHKVKLRNLNQPIIAMIGRVVPIKDVKTFIRACSILKNSFPNLLAYIMGPTEEDEAYFEECQEVIKHFSLQDTILFTGKVKLDDYLRKIDVNVLTSISEAQPLVILEVAAVGIPTVATNVGSCSELILGSPEEVPYLGPSGTVTPLANPAETAKAVAKLLMDSEWYEQCSNACKERVRKYYNKEDLTKRYMDLYKSHLQTVAQKV